MPSETTKKAKKSAAKKLANKKNSANDCQRHSHGRFR